MTPMHLHPRLILGRYFPAFEGKIMSTIVVPGAAGAQSTIVTTDEEHKSHGHNEYWAHGADRRVERQAAENLGVSVRQAAEVEARLGVQAALNAKDGIIEAAKNQAALTVQAALNAKDGVIEATRNAAAVAMQLAQSTSEIKELINERFKDSDAQAAECCCEIKAAVLVNTAKVVDQMNAIQASNLAIDLTDAKDEILALKVKAGTVT